MNATERVTVILTPTSSAALTRAAETTGDSRTDVINRAIQSYALLADTVNNGGRVVLRREPSSEAAEPLCDHGRTLGGMCADCDAAETLPHQPNPLTFQTSAGREYTLCRTCGQRPMRCPRPTGGEAS